MIRPPPRSPLFPYPPLFRSLFVNLHRDAPPLREFLGDLGERLDRRNYAGYRLTARKEWFLDCNWKVYVDNYLEGYHIPIVRSEEHTSELQSQSNLVCRLLLE